MPSPNSQPIAIAEIDIVSKHLIQTYPADFARFAFQRDDIEGVEVLDSGSVGLLPFASLIGQTEATWLEQCVTKAWDMPLERPVKADVLTGLTLLSSLVYNPQTITTIVSKEYLMDLMRESPFAQYLTQQAREEGIEQGIEQGIRESIQEVLELRFEPTAVGRLADQIEAIEDVSRLKQLHRAAIQVPSLEAFRNRLDADE